MKVPAALLYSAFYAMKAAPSALSSSFGAGVSPWPRMLYPAVNRHAKALFGALRPDWRDDEAALEAALRRLWSSAARTYAEVPSSHRLAVGGHVSLEHPERLDDSMASGRPVICAFVHTGNWEISGVQLACRYPGRAMAIYDPPKARTHAELVMRERRRMPAELIPMSRMVWRHALKRLRQPGGALWVPADEFAFHSVHAPFFGRPPRIDGNLGKIARLALLTDAIVVPFYGERHPGLRFTTHLLPPMTFEGDADDDTAIFAAVLALDAAITEPVIRHIDQWYMALFYRDFPANGGATA